MCIAAAFVLTGATAVAAEKIAFVDIQRIFMESEAGKSSALEFRKLVEKKQGQIQAQERELQKTQEELEQQRSVLTESAYREKDLDFQKRLRDYKRFVDDANEEMRMREQQMTQLLIPGIQKIINEIGKKENYTAIFDVGTGGLLFTSEAKDITGKVIEALNKVAR
jgi:outer membrane protein